MKNLYLILLYLSAFAPDLRSQTAEIKWGPEHSVLNEHEEVSFAVRKDDFVYVFLSHIPVTYMSKGTQRLEKYSYPQLALVESKEFEMNAGKDHIRFQFALDWGGQIWLVGEKYDLSVHIQKLFAQKLDLSTLNLVGEAMEVWTGSANVWTNFGPVENSESVRGGFCFSPDSSLLAIYSGEGGSFVAAILDRQMTKVWNLTSPALANPQFVMENHVGLDHAGNLYVAYRDYKINPVGRNGGDPDWDSRIMAFYRDGHPNRTLLIDEPGKLLMNARICFGKQDGIYVLGNYTEHGKYSGICGTYWKKFELLHSTSSVSGIQLAEAAQIVFFQTDEIGEKVKHIVAGGHRATADPYAAIFAFMFDDGKSCQVSEREFDAAMHHNASTRTDAQIPYHFGDVILSEFSAEGAAAGTETLKRNRIAIATGLAKPVKAIAGDNRLFVVYMDYDKSRAYITVNSSSGSQTTEIGDAVQAESVFHLGKNEFLVVVSSGDTGKAGIFTAE